ncbi:IS66 family insertion sequence element accessory protein TnpB [Parapusillimonas granuli]|uniref:IS66 family insertion sequence element accessory protein TnpB n=1 Tax=Parapusillimonas granuli TaxID=380911 RepID=UPI001809626F|nr:transposase [Parapusillimonas granuli]
MAALIRIDQIWLAVEPVDMRSGIDRLLARVVEVFGASQPYHAYLFANRRGTRLKVLVCDGFGVWLAVRRLHQGSMHWPRPGDMCMELTAEQAQALVIGLSWQRLGQFDTISIL